ncbi:MAG: tRNA (adenosine(37)-N6)-threonylcarbamoyltransferase complex dimerization subunit type 1 TsaB [Chlamydiota bacterium]|nr:tRNA (adenosine(37)-N6)-threonylcarbamoyltransferase complex dimerization subunit type 1 TsaB [Chlamydiota bacterium]
MTSLLIDTCTEQCIIVFFEGETVLYTGDIPKGHNSSRYAMIEVEKGLQKLGVKVGDLKYIAVGVGPGSYTGIRVGVTVAKTLAYAAKLPLVALCSLDGFIPDRDGTFMSIIDAKIGGAYFKVGSRGADEISWNTGPSMEQLKDIPHVCKVDYLVSPNSGQLQNKMAKLYPQQLINWVDVTPSVSYLMSVAEQKFKCGEYSTEAAVEILYLRKTQAEIDKA